MHKTHTLQKKSIEFNYQSTVFKQQINYFSFKHVLFIGTEKTNTFKVCIPVK